MCPYYQVIGTRGLFFFDGRKRGLGARSRLRARAPNVYLILILRPFELANCIGA